MKNSELQKHLEKLRNPILYETGGGIEYISPNIYYYTGIYAEEFSANRDLFPGKINPEDYVEANHKIREWHKHNEPGVVVTEFRFKTNYGEFIWMEDYLFSVKSKEKPKYMAGIMMDVTFEKMETLRLLQIKYSGKETDDESGIVTEEHLSDLNLQKSERKSAAEKIAEIITAGNFSMKDVFTSCYPRIR